MEQPLSRTLSSPTLSSPHLNGAVQGVSQKVMLNMARRSPSEPRMRRIVLERQQVMAHKHIPIETWLEALGMRDHYGVFCKYKGVEDLLNFTETEIKELGIHNPALRAKVVSSLRILKEKHQRGYKVVPGLHRSLSATAQQLKAENHPRLQTVPTSKPSYPDYQVVNVSAERLERDLTAELRSDPSELQHWPWYHGNISRQHAEKIVNRDGDFIVRDCISQPGDFVLTTGCRGVPIHFVINSQITERPDSKTPDISYFFEDEKFGSVQDLIDFYMSHKKGVTKTSGAVIKNPIGRTMPLSYYDSKYGNKASLIGAADFAYTPTQSPHASPYNSPKVSPRGSPKSRHKRPLRTGSQPLLDIVDTDERNNMAVSNMDRCDSLPSIPNKFGNSSMKNSVSASNLPPYHSRCGSEPVLMDPGLLITNNRKGQYLQIPSPAQRLAPASSDSNLSKPAPPKPSRIPSIKYKQRPKIEVRNRDMYDDDGRDYSDYSQVKEAPSWLEQNNLSNQNRAFPVDQNANLARDSDISDYDNNYNSKKIPYNQNQERVSNGNMSLNSTDSQRSRLSSDTNFTFLDNRDYAMVPDTPTSKTPTNKTSGNSFGDISSSDMLNRTKGRTISMPTDNVGSTLNILKYSSDILPEENKPLETSTLVTVKSLLLSTDPRILALHMTKVDLESLKVISDSDLGVGVESGLELMTLPQGKQLRQDTIERCCCLKLFTRTTILTCQKVTDRAKMLSQWIEIALQLRVTLGNLFAFSAVMEGLASVQIQRLRDTWMVLRQNHTSSAFTFDTKHKAALKSLNDGSGLLPLQNVSIPDISSLVVLLERDDDSLTDYLPWENADPNSGLDILLTHLDTARLITAQAGLYSVTGQALLNAFTPDTELLDIFRTEFQMKLLWGSKGASVERTLRLNKFEQLLTVLSNRAEPPGDDGTEV
ncbi:LOW QUALITY PROTEIN: breast cancer anti-estrogen resistance protein 3-like [Pecten maximus]|uniref:LOW QUALITY PROTEIN: breast cancer anti-estrogen resistance protein 3-like n=1 Tax=Pecten maximus TaxID=6579 RepID=UPI00145802DE|nr:LOW QUALITY PROTEIN: breast cancer anti-estrogen resistance protein 3-like [Pecten maximus]